MRGRKAVGPDNILMEVWKCSAEVAVEFLIEQLESERMSGECRNVLLSIFLTL